MDIAKYIKAKRNPTMTLLEFMQSTQDMVLKMAQEAIDKKLPDISEEVKNKLIEDITKETKDFLEKNFEKLQKEKFQMPAIEEVLGYIKPYIPAPIRGERGIAGRNGSNGTDGRNGENGRNGSPGPQGIEGKQGLPGTPGSPDTGGDIVKKINSLPLNPETMIDASHIKNLPRPKKEKKGGFGGAGGGSGSWHQKNLSGTIDGVNTEFTFTGEEPSQYSERVFLNYVEQNPVNGDYTINYQTRKVTYAVAPPIDFAALPHIIRYHT